MRLSLSAIALFCLLLPASANTAPLYDDFAANNFHTARWQSISLLPGAPAAIRVEDGVLVVSGVSDRSGAASTARIGTRGFVEADALGYTGINQILQVYGGSGGFSNMLEFGIEGKAPDGTPTLHIWSPDGEEWTGPAPSPGGYGPDKPLRLRVERDGNRYRFLVNGSLMREVTSDAIPEEARIVLYGFGKSVSRWDNVLISGPALSITSPVSGSTVKPPFQVEETVPEGASRKTLEVGNGEYPLKWVLLTADYRPAPNIIGAVTLRLSATDANGYRRSVWNTVTLDRAALWEPLEGQTVGPAFTAAVGGETAGYVTARYSINGRPAGVSTVKPFHARLVPWKDGPAVITTTLSKANGETTTLPPVNVTVKRNLYGRNPRVTNRGSAFVFPDGRVSVPIAFNDSYTWPGFETFWRTGEIESAVEHIRTLRSHGVNVVRMMLEAIVPEPNLLLESPLGHYNKPVTDFWDRILPLFERHGLTVLLTPWDTFWINQPWSASPYNKANGGPCVIPRDFITSPEARKWQKARIRTMIDRWGDSPAIFAYDLLNEHDIWWDATPQQRKAWLDDIAAYTRDYELRKWGHVHMLTVSSAAAEPSGIIADNVYRYPLFEFATTHLYYRGTVNDPKNAIDPALSFNHGIRYAQEQIQDGRPYTDSESGPIDRWVADRNYDEQVFLNETWAHFASGGAGTGMRWPYRAPHTLTPAMLRTLRAVSQVANRIDWSKFQARNADSRLHSNDPDLSVMGSGDEKQLIVWALWKNNTPSGGLVGATISAKGLTSGLYEVVCWDTLRGIPVKQTKMTPKGGELLIAVPAFSTNAAVTVRPATTGEK